MHYKNNSFRNLFIDSCFRLSTLIISATTLIAGFFHLYFGSLFFPVFVIFIMLFILLLIPLYLHSYNTLISSNKFRSIIFIIVLLFLLNNTIYFLFKSLIQFSIVELLTDPIFILDVFDTPDGLSFPRLKYINILNCLMKSLLFFLFSILILILNISLNFKSRFGLPFHSIQIFLIILNLAFIFPMSSLDLYYFFSSFGRTAHGFPCEILIHNYNFILFFFGLLLYILITILLFALPLTSGLNIALALVKEILFIEFVYFFWHFKHYTMTQTYSSDVFISYPFLRSFLTEEIYSFPLNITWF